MVMWFALCVCVCVCVVCFFALCFLVCASLQTLLASIQTLFGSAPYASL